MGPQMKVALGQRLLNYRAGLVKFLGILEFLNLEFLNLKFLGILEFLNLRILKFRIPRNSKF